MPFYRARKHTAETITQWLEFEAPDDDIAFSEANDGVSALEGEWVEIEKIEIPEPC